jgi:chaperonin cofactor prefoldin
MSASPIQDRVGELLAAQKQINHLRELVRDNESHVTRLESQVDVLKEEIRRLERNQKRYDGINLEYLKNIMVSFLDAENEKDRAPLLQVCFRRRTAGGQKARP